MELLALSKLSGFSSDVNARFQNDLADFGTVARVRMDLKLLWLFLIIMGPPIIAGLIVWCIPRSLFHTLLNKPLDPKSSVVKWPYAGAVSDTSEISYGPTPSLLLTGFIVLGLSAFWHFTSLHSILYALEDGYGGSWWRYSVWFGSFLICIWLNMVGRANQRRALLVFACAWVFSLLTLIGSYSLGCVKLCIYMHVLGAPILILTIFLTEIPVLRGAISKND
ncbi:MAG: hypothetical protein Alpg2KO_04090 [Alphaproteobacteria bacterium]